MCTSPTATSTRVTVPPIPWQERVSVFFDLFRPRNGCFCSVLRSTDGEKPSVFAPSGGAFKGFLSFWRLFVSFSSIWSPDGRATATRKPHLQTLHAREFWNGIVTWRGAIEGGGANCALHSRTQLFCSSQMPNSGCATGNIKNNSPLINSTIFFYNLSCNYWRNYTWDSC